MMTIATISGFTSSSNKDKCTDWSEPDNGVQFKYCATYYGDDQWCTYYDNLQWYNGNSYKVNITWKWQFKKVKGTSALTLEANETSEYSAIPDGYQINSIVVEQK